MNNKDKTRRSLLEKVLIKIINTYQKTISPDHGPLNQAARCVFYPSCSEYTLISIKKHGAIIGIYNGVRRVLKCHPWQKNHIDHPR